ncbi:L-asparaginase/archaeal Glu-tRNAGln amidotransferase subunit D [Lactococcus lactis subsp. lactis]|uniref:L-asparaginase/archaeal Glu-tRNAGln amidotransferase subunit D n=6 Tax=Lactococcus lactis TaxID=1358 RepID=A0A0B8QL78_LACLL|nr:L-asparaginase/archaeal Glu-tRNAGln amidotransferase subunit D [Lactococcus lactis subsp. lactis]
MKGIIFASLVKMKKVRTRKMTKFEEEVKRPKKAYIDPFSKRDVDFTGVAKKFTEGAQTLKEWKEYAFLLEDKLKLQQQALPVVPECVAEFITKIKKAHNSLRFAFNSKFNECPAEYWNEAIVWRLNNPDEFARAWLDGYQVEKPQLFYIDLPKVFGLSDSTSDSTFVSKAESGIISEFTKGKDYALKLTEQEIKSIDERYWQFAVPVEDGE